MPSPVSLAEVLNSFAAAQKEGQHTSLPAKVVSYDNLLQTVSVQPMIKRPVFNEDGEKSYEELPTITDVPVCFPRGGGFVITFPLAAGDFVWLVFSEAGIGEWRETGQLSEPQDVRRHSMGYPMAIPGVYPTPQPLSIADAAVRATDMFLGQDGGAPQIHISGTEITLGRNAISPVALAVANDANWALIKTWATSVSAVIAALVPVTGIVDPGTLKSTAVAAGGAVASATALTAATRVKAI